MVLLNPHICGVVKQERKAIAAKVDENRCQTANTHARTPRIDGALYADLHAATYKHIIGNKFGECDRQCAFEFLCLYLNT